MDNDDDHDNKLNTFLLFIPLFIFYLLYLGTNHLGLGFITFLK